MRRKRTLKVTDKKLNKLDNLSIRDLNLCTAFYYECIKHKGVLKDPNPKQMLNFIKQYHKNESNS